MASVAGPSLTSLGMMNNSASASPSPPLSPVVKAVSVPVSPPKKKNKTLEETVDSILHLKTTNRKLVLCMVGLPARGKTYIAKKLARFLSWMGYNTKVFNIGDYRRQMVGKGSSDFFDPNNPEGVAMRSEVATRAMEDMVKFLHEGGMAAIYDGTNTTKERRRLIKEFLVDSSETGELMWVESICNEKSIISLNIRETKLTSPDYLGVEAKEAIADFKKRIAMYEMAYEPLEEKELGPEECFVKLIDVGRQVVANRVHGYLPSKIVFFLMNLQLNKSPIYISRHGESMYNLEGKLGGDSPLTDAGKEYAKKLGQFIKQQKCIRKLGASVWCSTLQRTKQTAAAVRAADPGLFEKTTEWRALCEIEAGSCDGLTYEQVAAKDPDGFAARKADKLRYRYPQGESYMDVITRLEPVIFELERLERPVVVIGHQAVLRCLYAYFVEKPLDTVPHLSIPLHTVIKLTPKAYGCHEERFELMPSPDGHSD